MTAIMFLQLANSNYIFCSAGRDELVNLIWIPQTIGFFHKDNKKGSLPDGKDPHLN